MFCLKEHYLLSGNSRTYLRKPHQAVKTFCTQRPIDRLGETALCVILLISISLMIHELKVNCVTAILIVKVHYSVA